MKEATPTIPFVLDEDGVSKSYGFTKPWLRKRRRLGDGPPFLKLGRRMVRYRREDIEEYLRSCKRG
jgi:predicted DNA-binding transcriptional regulator AlpA